jgi:hypothetical protein
MVISQVLSLLMSKLHVRLCLLCPWHFKELPRVTSRSCASDSVVDGHGEAGAREGEAMLDAAEFGMKIQADL